MANYFRLMLIFEKFKKIVKIKLLDTNSILDIFKRCAFDYTIDNKIVTLEIIALYGAL